MSIVYPTTARPCVPNLSGAILLLNLTNVVSQSYRLYQYNYTAIDNWTCLTLSFRMDSDNWSLDTVFVRRTGTSTDVLVNGDFRLGTKRGWSSCNPNHASNSGFVHGAKPFAESGTYYWKDGSTGAEDYLYQSFATIFGCNYTISFYLKGGGGQPNTALVYVGPWNHSEQLWKKHECRQ